MCFLRPRRVKKVIRKKVILDDDTQAIVNEKVGKINKGDWVQVYGNLVLEKINGPKN